MELSQAAPQHHSALEVSIETKADLYAAYMPYIKNGGLFLHSKKSFNLGDEIFILLKLLDESEKFPVIGKVVWHTPVGAQSGMPAGIGVQFTQEVATLRKKIETYLVGLANSDKRTDTM